MTFDPKARLDPTSVTDARGGGGRMGGRGGLAVGGGGLGLVITIIYILLGGNPGALLGDGSGSGSGPNVNGPNSSALASCKTGADANQSQDCRIVGIVNSIQAFWQQELPGYEKTSTVLFSGRTSTGCGAATSAVGPFFCPADKTVYIDLTFFAELHQRFAAKGGPFAEAYVVAHEYGHHIQNLTGTDQQVGKDRAGPASGSVRLELQADCYAGLWTSHAKQAGFIVDLTAEDINIGLDAAAAVGDDRIQQAATGRVNPERFTHGTAEQRQRWFRKGLDTGSRAACNTFGAAQL